MTYAEWRQDYELTRVRQFMGYEREFGALLTRLRRRLYIPVDETDIDFPRHVNAALDYYVEDYHRTLSKALKDSAIFEVAGASLLAEKITGWTLDVISRGFAGIPDQVVTEAFARVLPSGYTLSQRIWDLHYSRDIITIVENGIANHVPAEVLSKQLDGFILPGRHVTTTTPYGRALNFDSMRLARTEIGRGYKQASIASANRSPWVKGITWHLSLEHPDIGCDCEDYDGQSYAVEDVPMEPHPQCLCYLTEDVMSGQEWDRAMSEYQQGVDNWGIGEWMEAA